MVMRHLLGLLLVLALCLGGCGDDSGGSDGSDAGTDGGATPDETPSGAIEPGEVVFVSESAVGGNVLSTATPIDSDAALQEFAEQFEDPRMGDRLAAEAADIDVPEGESLVAAVVALACDSPTEVSVEHTPAGLQVSSPPVKTDKQCLVPVTTVALVTVPESAL